MLQAVTKPAPKANDISKFDTRQPMQDNFFALSGDVPYIDHSELKNRLECGGDLRDFIFKPDVLTREDLGHHYKIRNRNFNNVSFTRTELRELIFQNCNFKSCLFISSSLVDCEFHNCKFHNCNVHKIEISGTYVAPESFLLCLNRKLHQNIGVHLFQTLMRNSKLADQPDFESSSRFYFLKWQRYQKRYVSGRYAISSLRDVVSYCKLEMSILWSLIFELLFGSGIRFNRFFATAVCVMTIFWMVNWSCQQQLGLALPEGKELNLISSFYYTVVSLTTVGYGDITPTTDLGHLWASLQSIVGFIMFALLASMFFRKIAP